MPQELYIAKKGAKMANTIKEENELLRNKLLEEQLNALKKREKREEERQKREEKREKREEEKAMKIAEQELEKTRIIAQNRKVMFYALFFTIIGLIIFFILTYSYAQNRSNNYKSSYYNSDSYKSRFYNQ